VRASFSLVDLIVIPIPIGADKIFSHCESCKSCFLIGRLVELLTNQNGRFIPGLLRLGVLCEKNTEQWSIYNHVWKCEPKLSFGQGSTDENEQLVLVVLKKTLLYIFTNPSAKYVQVENNWVRSFSRPD
jgi:hypothetical protein